MPYLSVEVADKVYHIMRNVIDLRTECVVGNDSHYVANVGGVDLELKISLRPVYVELMPKSREWRVLDATGSSGYQIFGDQIAFDRDLTFMLLAGVLENVDD